MPLVFRRPKLNRGRARKALALAKQKKAEEAELRARRSSVSLDETTGTPRTMSMPIGHGKIWDSQPSMLQPGPLSKQPGPLKKPSLLIRALSDVKAAERLSHPERGSSSEADSWRNSGGPDASPASPKKKSPERRSSLWKAHPQKLGAIGLAAKLQRESTEELHAREASRDRTRRQAALEFEHSEKMEARSKRLSGLGKLADSLGDRMSLGGGVKRVSLSALQRSKLRRRLIGELEMRREERGEQDPDTLLTLNRLAKVLHEQGQLKLAEQHFREALELRRATHGASHPHTHITANGLAMVLKDRQEYEEAEALLKLTLDNCRTNLGSRHRFSQQLKRKLERVVRLRERAEAEKAEKAAGRAARDQRRWSFSGAGDTPRAAEETRPRMRHSTSDIGSSSAAPKLRPRPLTPSDESIAAVDSAVAQRRGSGGASSSGSSPRVDLSKSPAAYYSPYHEGAQTGAMNSQQRSRHLEVEKMRRDSLAAQQKRGAALALKAAKASEESRRAAKDLSDRAKAQAKAKAKAARSAASRASKAFDGTFRKSYSSRIT